jgi:ribose transport system ATP-binding protein
MENSVPPLWELRGITKVFPAVKAIDNLSLNIYPGEVLGLIGENGSGKSTLIKCLAGVHAPTEGEILYQGTPMVIHDPMMAKSLGVATIFQEFSLVQTLSVAENVFLGRLPQKTTGGRKTVIDWEEMRRKTVVALSELQIDIDPDVKVASLSVAEQQLVEIAKALSMEAMLFIMDEPTAAIGLTEIKRLHEMVKRLSKQGCAIIYITHRMDEILDIVDRVMVMKDGQVVGEAPIAELDLDKIVKMMIGSDVKEHYPKVKNTTDEFLLAVNDIYTDNGVNGVSFTVKRGEVFGLAGLIGSGRTEIAQAIFGADPITQGEIVLGNMPASYNKPGFSSPREAIKYGIALVTEDRKYSGLFMNFRGPENITIASLKKLLRRKFLNLKQEEEVGLAYVEKLKIPSTAQNMSVQFLSGGNQQKVVISRWLFSQAELVIFDEPTRGIDVGAKVEVYNLINELTRQGKGVIIISSDFPELLAMSDRVAVVNHGRIIEIQDTQKIDRTTLMQMVFIQKIVDYPEPIAITRQAGFDNLRHQDGKTPRIAFMPAGNEFTYLRSVGEGIKAVTRIMGADVFTSAPQSGEDVEGQLDRLRQVIQQDVDGIILSTHDEQAVAPLVQEAVDKGIVVVLVNSDNKEFPVPLHGVVGYKQRHGTHTIGEYAIQRMTGKDTIVGVIEGSPGTHSTERCGGFLDAIEGKDNFKVVANRNGHWNTEGGYAAAKEMLEAHPEINLLFCANDHEAVGAAKVIEELEKTDILLLGNDGDTEALEHIYEGKISATVNTTPYVMGQIAMQVVADSLAGKFQGGHVESPLEITDEHTVLEYLRDNPNKLYPKPSKDYYTNWSITKIKR